MRFTIGGNFYGIIKQLFWYSKIQIWFVECWGANVDDVYNVYIICYPNHNQQQSSKRKDCCEDNIYR